MKKIILTLAVLVMTTISINAQESKEPRKSPEERTEKIVTKMKTDLALSDDQVTKLKPIILKREQKRDALRSTMSDAKDRHKEMAKETEDDLKNILSPEQMEKLKQQRKEMREKHMQKKKE